MIEKQIFKGYWKLPEEKNFRLSGELVFDPVDGGTLTVMGSFGNQNERTGEESHTIIHGFTTDGKRLTLRTCVGISNNRVPGIPLLQMRVETILIGSIYIDTEDDSIFDGATFHIKHLDEWVEISGFQNKVSNDDLLEISYLQPKPIKIHETNFSEVTIWFHYVGANFGTFIKQSSIKQTTLFQIDFKSKQNLEQIFKSVEILRNFISFGVSLTCQTTEITLIKKIAESKTIYFEALISSPRFEGNHGFVSSANMLFSFKDIKTNYTSIFNSWFNLHEELSPVFELYFQSIYNQNLGAENYFLNLIFALETFHRRTSDNSKFQIEEYKKIKECLIEKIKELKNADYENWLKGKLLYGNEISLRNRLNSLLDNSHSIFQDRIKDKKEFISKMIDTRNYYVHYDKSLESKAIKNELFSYSRKLKILLQLSLLKKLGFENEQMGKFMQRTPIFWNIDN